MPILANTLADSLVSQMAPRNRAWSTWPGAGYAEGQGVHRFSSFARQAGTLAACFLGAKEWGAAAGPPLQKVRPF